MTTFAWPVMRTAQQKRSHHKGDINDPKYRQGLVDMPVNKIHLYDDKMTVLCDTQDGHFDVALKDVSSLKGQLVEARHLNPNHLYHLM